MLIMYNRETCGVLHAGHLQWPLKQKFVVFIDISDPAQKPGVAQASCGEGHWLQSFRFFMASMPRGPLAKAALALHLLRKQAQLTMAVGADLSVTNQEDPKPDMPGSDCL